MSRARSADRDRRARLTAAAARWGECECARACRAARANQPITLIHQAGTAC